MSDNILDEFSAEANELLDEAERSLLALDKDGDFNSNFDSVFRAFHSVKGSAGMLGLIDLQHHVHSLEDRLQALKSNPGELKLMINYFISGVDLSRRILTGEKIDLKNSLKEFEITPSPGEQTPKTEKYNIVGVSITDKELLDKVLNLSLDPLLLIKFKVIEGGPECLVHFENSGAMILLSDSPLSKVKTDFGSILAPIILINHDAEKGNIKSEVFHLFQYLNGGDDLEYTLRNALRHSARTQLLNRAKSLILYMYADVESYLVEQKKIEVKNSINSQMKLFFKDFLSIN